MKKITVVIFITLFAKNATALEVILNPTGLVQQALQLAKDTEIYEMTLLQYETQIEQYAKQILEYKELVDQGLAIKEELDTLRRRVTAVVQTGNFRLALNVYREMVGQEEINRIITELSPFDPTLALELAEVVEKTFKHSPQNYEDWEDIYRDVGSEIHAERDRQIIEQEYKTFELYVDQMRVLAMNHEDGVVRRTAAKELGGKIAHLGDASDLETLQIIAAQNQIRSAQQEASLELLRESIKERSHVEMQKAAQLSRERTLEMELLAEKHNAPLTLGGANADKPINELLL